MFDNIMEIIKAKTNQMNYYGCEYAEPEAISIPSGMDEKEYNELTEALNELIDASMSAGRLY